MIENRKNTIRRGGVNAILFRNCRGGVESCVAERCKRGLRVCKRAKLALHNG